MWHKLIQIFKNKKMKFIAEDNPNLYIYVENYNELEEKIKKFGNPNYNYEVIFEFRDPRIAGRIRAIEKRKDRKES